MGQDDRELIKALIEERRKLHQQLSALTDRAIADKFGISVYEVREVSRGVR